MNIDELSYYKELKKYKDDIYILENEVDNDISFSCDNLLELLPKYSYGASKFCIIEKDFVLKIPIAGRIYVDDNEIYKYNEDYCDLEWSNYLLSEEAHLEGFFAKTKRVTKNLFIQEKLIPFYDYEENKVPDSKYILRALEILQKQEEHYTIQDTQIISILLSQHTEDEYYKLNTFFKENHINDLHSNNFGFDNQGKLKLFDYSGYVGDFACPVT